MRRDHEGGTSPAGNVLCVQSFSVEAKSLGPASFPRLEDNAVAV